MVAGRYSGGGGSISIIAPGGATPAANISNPFSGGTPYGVAVDSQGNFYVGQEFNTVGVIDANATSISRTITGFSGATSVAVGADDTLYVASRNANQVDIVPFGAVSVASSVAVGGTPVAVAVGPSGTVLTSNFSTSNVSVIPAGSATSSVLTAATMTHGVAVAPSGLIYIAKMSDPGVIVMAELGAALASPVGDAGGTATVNVTGLPVGTLIDDTDLAQVWWGDDTVAFTRNAGANSVSFTIPEGTDPVPVVLEFDDGQAVTAGTFSYAPPPPPPVRATAPGSATAVAGDRSATITWTAPSASGDFAITNYQVIATPGRSLCITSTLTCTVPRLVNGGSYTFKVRALTGAGWGEWSESSNAVTPQASLGTSIVISGTRGEVRGRLGIIISGQTTGMGMGAILRPWTRSAGQPAFIEGSADILVDMSGDFEWQRRSGRKVLVYLATPDGSVRSNIVTIPLSPPPPA